MSHETLGVPLVPLDPVKSSPPDAAGAGAPPPPGRDFFLQREGALRTQIPGWGRGAAKAYQVWARRALGVYQVWVLGGWGRGVTRRRRVVLPAKDREAGRSVCECVRVSACVRGYGEGMK